MYENIILTPPCCTYGDILSIIGMLYFLLEYYNNVYLMIHDEQNTIREYYINYFKKCEYFQNNRLHVIKKSVIEHNINKNEINHYHVCNTHTGSWCAQPIDYLLKNDNKINSKYYFCDKNPLYNVLNIDINNKCEPNLSIPLKNIEINHIIYYKLIGLNNNVRLNYFNYTRDIEKEKLTTKMIKEKYNLGEDEKYNIIYCPESNINTKDLIKNNFKTINIHYLVDFPGWLLDIIEHAEHIYLIEGNVVNFIYHCQYKKIININKSEIFFYTNIRKRYWPHFKLDYAWKMMDVPKLDHWNFLH